MTPAPLELDFVATPRSFSLAGVLVLLVGIAACGWTVADYRALTVQSELLEIERDMARPSSGRVRRAGRTIVVDARGLDHAREAVGELSLPWSQLLDDLETAGQARRKDVALLSIEPDREKQRIRIGAEARTLPAALDFLKELQAAGTLAYPLLDSHKVRKEIRERPVYFELTADWSLPQ